MTTEPKRPRGRPAVLTVPETQRAAQLRREGLSWRRIADLLGAHHVTVWRAVEAMPTVR